MRNSCGIERRKLSSSGKKNNMRVLLNLPRIPLTANVMPARYVNESPTNTCEGYLRVECQFNHESILSCRVPVEVQKCQHTCQKRKHEVEREQVSVAIRATELNQVVNDDRHGNHCRLTRLKTINARVDVDAVRAEHCDHWHVQVIKITNRQLAAEIFAQRFGYNDIRGPTICD